MRKYIKNYGICLRTFLLFLPCLGDLTAHATGKEEIIEFQGDRYVIHVDRMAPDSEMTLMDVLNTSPEFLSINGKQIDLDYKLRIDNIDVVLDPESFLANVKACEIDYIQICSNTSVAKTVNGTKGIIDIYYREDAKTNGKVALAGSTYGSGRLYTDVTSRTGDVTVQAYAMGRTSYGKSYPTDRHRMTDRGLAEAMHLSIDWKMSPNDKLLIKAFQKFEDNKQKLFYPTPTEAHPYYNRYIDLVLSYSHTFKNDAILFAEIGSDYTRKRSDDGKTGDCYPYGFVEINTPIFTSDLWLMAGVELDYENTWNIGQNREQYMQSDFYAQLDYTNGPWVLTLGDRFRIMNFWNRQHDAADQSLWSHSRNNHSYLVSAGYKAGCHFMQAQFTRRYFIPGISDFLTDETAPTTDLKYDAGCYSTNLVHQGVLRYSYQQKNFFLHTSLENNWFSDLSTPNYQILGIRNSIYWKTAPCELTLGANYYHQHQKAGADTASDDDDFVTLKAAPAIVLPKGFRLSTVLLYSSRRAMTDQHAHLFASVKINKQLGKKCNVFDEFHDMGGYTTGTWSQLAGLYQNRALTAGATFYPFHE